MTFDDMFRAATATELNPSGVIPYPYQSRFASEVELPSLVNAPTGSGKTATGIVGWLYRRRFHPNKDVRRATPRRLVYCLPMRTLVEQTAHSAERWLKQLGLLAESPGDNSPASGFARQHERDEAVHRIAVSVLIGGEDLNDWHLYPERDAVLIGTQDMLLSRALNRGYGASRFHWPIDFAFLNSDCLWIFDEPQLMANGVSTTAQLAGLRQALATIGNSPSLWMSATLEPAWLNTVDFNNSGSLLLLTLGAYDGRHDLDPSRPLYQRMTAAKELNPLDAASSSDMKAVAQAVLAQHIDGTQTLVIVNTVDRAKATIKEIERQKKKAGKEHTRTLLVHSRFRPIERQRLNALLQDDKTTDRIIVATQVVEAGIDLSARTLITELAPWASVVQRIGRCNRTGNDGPGRVFWIDLTDKQSPPYAHSDLGFAREQLLKLARRDVSPLTLDAFKRTENIVLPFEHKHVLRRRDLLDLFDTAPDLSGNDIDVQRFVRSDDPDIDVQVFWRDLAADAWDAAPTRDELCSVPVGSFKMFLKNRQEKFRALVWDHLDDDWRDVRDVERDVRPGLTFLLPTKAGGYSELGWDPESTVPVTLLPPPKPQRPEGIGSDFDSAISTPLTIAQHTQDVCDELPALLRLLPEVEVWSLPLQQAARWHDVGKAHWAFQEGVRYCNPTLNGGELWAKSGRNGRMKHGRKYFRHELASALAALQHELPFISAYLIAAHHGRVRLSIRALPDEEQPKSAETLFALGVHQADKLPEVILNGEACSAVTLDLSPMKLGGTASWTARALALLSELGPFRLAYLEALLRTADVRASRKEAQR